MEKHIKKKAQDEVREVVRMKSKVVVNNVNQICWLHAPVSFLDFQRNICAGYMQLLKLAGYDIPFKTIAYVIAWDIHLCNWLHYVLAQKISAKSTSFNV